MTTSIAQATLETSPPNPTVAATIDPPQEATLKPKPNPDTFKTQKWEGEFNQYSYKTYPMILYIEKVNGPLFEGKLHWPTLRNSITSVNGEYVTDFGDVVEQSKWSFIKDFKPDVGGTWITFTETELLQGGNIVLHNRYYGHIRDDGTMFGYTSIQIAPHNPAAILLSY